MNPDTNKFERLLLEKYGDGESESDDSSEMVAAIKRELHEMACGQLYRPNGEPVPKHWSVFTVGETYVINNYTFRCMYIGETSILFEPVGSEIVGK